MVESLQFGTDGLTPKAGRPMLQEPVYTVTCMIVTINARGEKSPHVEMIEDQCVMRDV